DISSTDQLNTFTEVVIALFELSATCLCSFFTPSYCTDVSAACSHSSYTAVSVALFNEFKCLGPNPYNTIVIYKHVFINLGNGYSVDTGIFTVPRSGVYSLALTVYSDSGSPGSKLAACAGLLLNGQLVAATREINMEDQEDSATIVVALHLTAGDKVAVNLPIGCFLCDDSSHYNTFSAFLLYPE
uniref:Cerebellin 20 n=1 Tax=Sander lucioperca TaxID=283035 RepID=A0A8C9ZRV3_SANLU